MSSDCIRISEAIWDFARGGAALTQKDMAHIGSCKSCAETYYEARSCIEALAQTQPHPTAPDCRSAVMSRISNRRMRFAPALSYACGVVVVAAAVAGYLLCPRSTPIAKTTATAVKPPTTAPSAVQPKANAHALAPEPPVIVRPRMPHRSRPARWARVEHRRVETAKVVAVATKPTRKIAESEKIPSADGTSALAYVTWSTQPQDSYDYSYTSTDPASGEVTKCSVKREGRTIEINMESEPAKSEPKPIKESRANEAAICS